MPDYYFIVDINNQWGLKSLSIFNYHFLLLWLYFRNKIILSNILTSINYCHWNIHPYGDQQVWLINDWLNVRNTFKKYFTNGYIDSEQQSNELCVYCIMLEIIISKHTCGLKIEKYLFLNALNHTNINPSKVMNAIQLWQDR